MLKIGLLIQDLATDYSTKIVKGTKKYCNEHGIQLFIYIIRSKNWPNGTFDYQHFATKALATKENIDGIVLVTNTYCQHFPKEQHAELIEDLLTMPVVSFGAEVPGLSSVSGNEVTGFKELLNHLYTDHNCKNIYILGPKANSKDIQMRFNAYFEFQKEHNQSYDDKILYADYTYHRVKETLTNKGVSKDNLMFDCVVSCNDTMAFGCIDYLKEQGISVPDDVKITGFDNQIRCDFTTPGLTTINQCIEEQCYKAAEVLHNEILDPSKPKQNYYVDAQVVIRQSCGCNRTIDLSESFDDKYYNLKNQLQHYQQFLQDMQVEVEQEKIINYFKNFEIESCVCCIYDHPKVLNNNENFILPEKARIYFAYNQEKVFEYDDGYYLNPKENMYSSDFTFAPGKEVIVTSLFTREYQYGYILYTPGELNYNTYDLIMATTAIALSTKLEFNEKNNEQQRLFTDKKNLETESYYDELTGLLNRRGFFHFGSPALQSTIERKIKGGIIFGDMDHLKFINDNYGHNAGDSALKEIAELLKSAFRSEDLIARLGGDEFVILAAGLTEKDFEHVKTRLYKNTKKVMEQKKFEYELSISLGYAEFGKYDENLESLMKQADENQYKEKVLHHKKK